MGTKHRSKYMRKMVVDSCHAISVELSGAVEVLEEARVANMYSFSDILPTYKLFNTG